MGNRDQAIEKIAAAEFDLEIINYTIQGNVFNNLGDCQGASIAEIEKRVVQKIGILGNSGCN